MSQTLLNKMRQLSIKQLKSRRQQLFQKTRKIIENYQQSQCQNNQDSYLEQESNHQITKYQKINEQVSIQTKRKLKKNYWKKLLQISDWMIDIPCNFNQYYVASRPDGNKCLLIFDGYRVQIRNKSGNMVIQFQYPNKMYDGTILQGYLNLQQKKLVISDLIVWKNHPFTSNQFQFRIAWIMSNILSSSINIFMQNSKLQIFLIQFYPINIQNLKKAYQQVLQYPKEGLIFVHKDSLYVHGLNPQSLIWKDLNISKYLVNQINQNLQSSKGIAFMTKNGQIKSLQGIVLFQINRQNFNKTHRYLKFSYKQVHIDNIEEDKVTIHFDWINIIQTLQYFNNTVDSISKLLYKSKISHQSITIQQLLDSIQSVSNMKQQIQQQ